MVLSKCLMNKLIYALKAQRTRVNFLEGTKKPLQRGSNICILRDDSGTYEEVRNTQEPGRMVHKYYQSSWEREARLRVQGQLGLHIKGRGMLGNDSVGKALAMQA